jgi:hypothetical protein
MSPIQHSVELTIPANQSSVSKEFTLQIGFVPKVVAYTNGIENATKEMLKLALYDNNGEEIIPPVNIKNWEQKSGAYMESMKPLGIEAQGKQYKLIFTTNRNLAQVPPISIQPQVEVVFVYSKSK